MEILRWPTGGLNLDDSVELLSPDDWSFAKNIISGRSHKGKNGEKENVRGTTLVEAASITVLTEANSAFSVWSNGTGTPAWVLGNSPNVALGSSQVSGHLKLVLANPASGKVTVKFNISVTNTNLGAVSINCAIRDASGGNLDTKGADVYTDGTLPVTFEFDHVGPIVDIIIFAVSGAVPAEENLGELYTKGTFETLPTSPQYTGHGTISRDSSVKYSGTYSGKMVSAGLSFTGFYAGSNSISAGKVQVGDRLKISARIYIPSSNPSTYNAYVFTPYMSSDVSGFNNQYSFVSSSTKTVSDCVNTWQYVEAVYDVTALGSISSGVSAFIKLVNTAIPDGTPFTIASGYTIYIDELYLTREVAGPATRTVTLSSPVVNTEVEAEALDVNSEYIGGLRSAKDNLSFLFFYNSDSSKNCILKLENNLLSLVLMWSGLNFDPSHRINGGAITDTVIYFTDNHNEPRCVSRTRYLAGGQPINEDEILLIRRGPQFAPLANANLITSGNTASLDGDYQFAYQYEYEDGQMSVISPYTGMKKKTIGSQKIQFYTVGMTFLTSVTEETLPALVKKIHFIVREGNNGTAYRFSTKAVADFASFLDIFTVYEGQGGEVVEDIYLKSAELVPTKAKTMAFAKNRLWLGNYTEGYDLPDSSDITLTASIEEFGADADEGFTISANSEYGIGIVFKDGQGRSTGVMDKGKLKTTFDMPIWNGGSIAGAQSNAKRKRFKVKVSGDVPTWAKYYSIVMTKDLRKSSFINSYWFNAAGSEMYVNEDNNGDATYSLNHSTATKFNRLGAFNIKAQGIGYTFLEGDMALIHNMNNNTVYGPVAVKSSDGEYIFTEPVNAGGSGSGAFNYSFQIFRPYKTTETQLYYEVYTKQILNSQLDNVDRYIDGDCVSRNTGLILKRECMSYSSIDWNTHIGKPYIKVDVGQVVKPYFFRHSSTIIPGTNINGLSEFNVGDEGTTDFEAGEIQRLQPTSKASSESDIILAICNTNTYSIYIGESRLSSGNQSFLVAAAKIIGDVRPQGSGFGTINPESVHEEDGYIYWYDHYARSFVRYASNGIFPLSEYKMTRYFEEQSQLNEGKKVVCGFDPYYKILFVTFETAETTTKKTVGYSITQERWVSFFDFAPEGYVIGSDKIYTVKDGAIYAHDNTADGNFNKFYGVTYNSRIDLSFNDEPHAPKEWRVIQVQGSPNLYSFVGGDQVATDTLTVELTNRHNQETDILTAEFEVDENIIYGEIRGDKNTGGLLDGDPIFSNTMQCAVTFSGGSFKQIVALKAGFLPSRGHNL